MELNLALLIAVCVLVSAVTVAGADAEIEEGECSGALGMEAGRIPDTSISASSSYEAKSVGPQNARIRQETNGGAWCPKAQISSEVREFLEVDLQREHLITRTETQGRFGNGQGQEYAEQFLLEYWRPALSRWTAYRDHSGDKVLAGNSNTYLPARQDLALPFVATKVRFIPFSEHPRTVCMRVELYGCIWDRNVMQYVAPPADIPDRSYDGALGQLVDTLRGPADFRNHDSDPIQGRWVGWRNESLRGRPVEITFHFPVPREFTEVKLHLNNRLRHGAQVPSLIRVMLSADGKRFQPPSAGVQVTLGTDLPKNASVNDEAAKEVVVPLGGRPAKSIRVQLFFSSTWILLSEVSFDSVLFNGNLTDDMIEMSKPIETNKDKTNEIKVTSIENEVLRARKDETPTTTAASEQGTYIGLISGVLSLGAIMLGITVLLFVRRGRQKVSLLHKHTALVCNTKTPGQAVSMKDLKIAPGVNTLSFAAGNGTTYSNGHSLGRARLTSSSKNKNGYVTGPRLTKNNVYGQVVGGEESDSENSLAYHEPYKLLMPSSKQEYGCLLAKELSSSKSGEYTDFTSIHDEPKYSSSSIYHLTLGTRSQSKYDVKGFSTPSKALARSNENFYAATDIVKSERREQHLSVGRFTCLQLPNGLPMLDGNASLLEFQRHRLRVIQTMGDGMFGTMHMCEADGTLDFANTTTNSNKRNLVLAKTLHRGCDTETQQEFLREASWLSSLRDPNVSRVVALCSQDGPLCVLQEFTDLRELPLFLRQQENLSLSYGCLIYMATQVASGMKYLESLDITHRDLSARNCIVTRNLQIKVSDHAIFCSAYDSHYYSSDTGSRLPIRWMAWESLLMGQHSPRSDVWSFAVTLWEILGRCRELPYCELTSEQVVENCSHYYQDSGMQRALSRPPLCPREIYDLMAECWRRGKDTRPRFHEIHLFLQRKNLGYEPATG